MVAVNDPFLTPEYAAYQFKYDSVHGVHPAEVTFGDGVLMIGDVTVKFFSERNPAGELVWFVCWSLGSFFTFVPSHVSLGPFDHFVG